jgi:hypothetical protein
MSLDSSMYDAHNQLDRCSCTNCDHETIKNCIANQCRCCDLEHAYFLSTGDHVENELV